MRSVSTEHTKYEPVAYLNATSVPQHGATRRDGRGHHGDLHPHCPCAACTRVLVHANGDDPAADAAYQTAEGGCTTTAGIAAVADRSTVLA